jgi:outer membrane lipoprotein LolB
MRRGVFAASLLAFAGCASVPPSPPGGTPPSVDGWTLQGRFSVDSGDERVSGSIRWAHRGGRDELLLTSPLGQAVARIALDADGAMLELPKQAPRRAVDADALTREAFGYTLPVAGLAWWVQGRPDPARAFDATRDGAGRLEELRQDGWIIQYRQYVDEPGGYPRKLRVSREDLEIRLVADSWEGE